MESSDNIDAADDDNNHDIEAVDDINNNYHSLL